MEIDVSSLLNGRKESIDFLEIPIFEKSELLNVDLLDLKDVSAEGTITRFDDFYNFELEIKGIMILPCSVTLKPVEQSFDIKVNNDLETILSELDENFKYIPNLLDILPIIWQNIVMEIPIKVTSPDAYDQSQKGEGWELLSEDDDKPNTALAGLKDLFKKEV
jgi:uncharacterized protein